MRAITRRTGRRPTAGRGGARRAAVVAVALAALALGLAACGTSLRDEGGKQASQQAGSGPRPIKLASVFCVCFIGPYVAMRQGFFEREGVPVKQYVATKGGADTFQALAGGDVDFAISGLDAIIRGQSKGLKVRSVAAVYPEFYALTVRKDLAGKIRSIDDLKGRKVAISKIGSASWAFLQFVTRGAGLKEGDVKMLQLGGIDTIVAGLKAGKVDAAVTWQPGTARRRPAARRPPAPAALAVEPRHDARGARRAHREEPRGRAARGSRAEQGERVDPPALGPGGRGRDRAARARGRPARPHGRGQGEHPDAAAHRGDPRERVPLQRRGPQGRRRDRGHPAHR
jgi:ABC-type amino acid transport substrate-binding protein